MASVTQTVKPISRRFAVPRVLRSIIGSQEAVLFLALVLLIAYVGNENGRFLATRNMVNVFSGNAYIAVAAIGMTMVIITGNIDISVGSLMVTLAMFSGAISIYTHFPSWMSENSIIWLAWIAPLIVGGIVGAIIGFFVTYLRIPAIVVSLGFMSILKGILIIVSEGERITGMPDGYALAQRHPLEKVPLPIFEDFFHGLTMPIFFMFGLIILVALWMRYSATGRALYAVGGNAEAARLSGISEHRILMLTFILNGFFVGIASVLYATQFSVIQVTLPPIEMTIITAVVVGGVSILGGTGTVIGAMLAAILLNTITKALVFVDISPFWMRAIQGVLILITVLADLLRRQRQSA
ncbi:MAG TPA: ABC transporter permease [Aggregatilineaceae bacterium]|nr:ABC transporter permease [Aggregatilineaceae bacterium]